MGERDCRLMAVADRLRASLCRETMGNRSHFRRSSGLRFLLRLLSVLAALCVLSVSGRASAAPSNAVPMCGEHNESVAAPPLFRLSDDGSIRALPCHASSELGVSQGGPILPEPVIVYERPERVLGLGALLIAQSESSLLSIDGASRELARPGVDGSLCHPPRA